MDFPNKYAGSSFQDPCLLTIPFTVLPSVTIVANTKTQFPEGAIACEGRISVIEKATVLVEEVDDDNNSLGVTDEFEKFSLMFHIHSIGSWEIRRLLRSLTQMCCL